MTRLAHAVLLTLTTVASSGCLDRPVAPAEPKTTTRSTIKVPQNNVDKIDLLFMIDNSASMADKQTVLAEAVPDLVDRLINPPCVAVAADGGTSIVATPARGAACPTDSDRAFAPIADIHIGVITSSMGTHGAGSCEAFPGDVDDHGRLITRGGASTYRDLGFLAWDPGRNKNDPPGESDEGALTDAFTSLVKGAGQTGCGFEHSLEAWYRFLVDPDPPASITAGPDHSAAIITGRDDALLAQRKAFLRPDSLVAVISLSDENDCSVRDTDQAYLVLAGGHLLKGGTSICKSNPNDRCCFNCNQKAPDGCSDPAQDPACAHDLTEAEDPSSLRCFDQKRKFGVDFLFPVERYIEGLTKPTVTNRAGATVPNPLFSDLQCQGGACKPPRDPSIVFFAGIAGVPWQDIAVDPRDLSKGYKTAKELASVWPAIMGDPTHSPPIPPTDPLMVESIAPRDPGKDPITGEALASVSAARPDANSVNGHEWNADGDLQYACVFNLPPDGVRTCSGSDNSCDCAGENQDAIKSPLCQDTNGAYGNTQYRAKGYPGIRFLQVLRGIGDQGIVASICPANLKPESKANGDRDYGYRPAVEAISNKLAGALTGHCLSRELEVNSCQGDPAYDKAPCIVLEAFSTASKAECEAACNEAGRSRPNPAFLTPDVTASGNCVCAIDELIGNDATACLTERTDDHTGPGGWCYVSPQQHVGNAAAAGKCDNTVRFFGTNGVPRNGAAVTITCQEKAFDPGSTRDGGASCSGGL